VFSSPTSRWTAGAAAVGAGVVAICYVTVIGPKRGEAAQLADATASAQQQNDALQVRIAQLKAQFASLPQRQAELSTMLGQMPVTADIPHFVRSLDALASDSGVILDAVTPTAAQALGASSAAPATGTGTTGSGTTGTGTTGSGTAASAGSAGVGAPAGGNGSQVVTVPITVTVHGPYFKAVTFLKNLQSGQRAFLVTGLQVAVAGSDITMTVRGRVFAVPSAAQALNTPSTPASSASTPAPSASTSAPSASASAASPVPSPSR
jgi:hypothetical protein